MLQACLFLINSSSMSTRPVARSWELMNVEWPTFTATFSKIAFLGDNLRAFCRQEPFGRGELATWGRSMAPGSLCPRHWNGARLCRRPAAARGKFEGVGSLPRAAVGRGRHSRAPIATACGARLCRRPAAARGKFEGVGSLPRAAAGRGRHSRAPAPSQPAPFSTRSTSFKGRFAPALFHFPPFLLRKDGHQKAGRIRPTTLMYTKVIFPFILVLLAFAAVPDLCATPKHGPQAGLDSIRRWNQIAIDASGLDHTPPAPGETRVFREQLGPGRASRAMAIVHIAMFDAVNAVGGEYESYTGVQAPRGPLSLEAAISQAAHDTLAALFPAQSASFDTWLAEDLAEVKNKNAKANGIERSAREVASGSH